ncbi:MAG TPA: ATP-binding cassette domain-containing protein [Rhodocyclaceae bacterium]|nr:ATP-binding cassette domain-containing protein [Rhodocyclaceae bacterium]
MNPPGTPRGLVLEIDQVSTVFGREVVHRDLSFTVAEGEVLALIGASGSGKTTLLREVVGLMRPTRGDLRLFGQALHGATRKTQRDVLRRVGVMFQHGALFSAFSVYDNIAFPLRELRRFDDATIARLVMAKLDMVGLEARHARLEPAKLSGGMIKRAALARALALEPEFLVLDEPTAGLDPGRAAAFVRLIKMLQEELHLTVLMVTHDLDTLSSLSSRVVALADHRVVADGPLDAVMALEHPFVQSFFTAAGHEVS